MTTSPATMLAALPPCTLPSVITTGTTGDVSRLTSVCKAVTTCAAMMTASMVRWGCAP